MRKTMVSSAILATVLFVGCGGGGDDSTETKAPEILLSNDTLSINTGDVYTVNARVSNVPSDSNSEVNVFIDSANDKNQIIDYVSYSVTNGLEKDIDIIIYGANNGIDTLTVEAKNSHSSLTKNLSVTVNPIDDNIDVANPDTNINNEANEKREVTYTQTNECIDTDSINAKATLTVKNGYSPCGYYKTYITDSTISIEESDEGEKSLINLKLSRYNNMGYKFYASNITDLKANEKNINGYTRYSIPNDRKEFGNGTNFALDGVRLGYTYELNISTDMCNVQLDLSIANICTDTDGDGVPDSIDYCPNTSTTNPDFVDERGCFIDTDGDGFFDNVDNCINVIGQFNGCPDTDGDGLPDDKDKCPTEAGSIDNEGCPATTTTSTSGTTGTTTTSTSGTTGTTTTSTSGTTGTTTTSTSGSTGIVVDDTADACTENNGYVGITHKLGIPTFANGYITFRTETPYTLTFYYKNPETKDIQKQIDLNSYAIPDTDYNFFLQISSILADGNNFYVSGDGKCYRGTFPTLQKIEKGDFPDKSLTIINKE